MWPTTPLLSGEVLSKGCPEGHLNKSHFPLETEQTSETLRNEVSAAAPHLQAALKKQARRKKDLEIEAAEVYYVKSWEAWTPKHDTDF